MSRKISSRHAKQMFITNNLVMLQDLKLLKIHATGATWCERDTAPRRVFGRCGTRHSTAHACFIQSSCKQHSVQPQTNKHTNNTLFRNIVNIYSNSLTCIINVNQQ